MSSFVHSTYEKGKSFLVIILLHNEFVELMIFLKR